MGLLAGQKIREGDFINTSAGSGDAGKATKLDSDGDLARTFMKKVVKFGGDGSNGALAVSSGTTQIDCGGAAVYERNYTSISITGTGKVEFINPHANGTVVILRSQGNVVITSSATPAIDLRGMGAAGAAQNTAQNGSKANGILFSADAPGGVYGNQPGSGNGGAGGGAISNPEFYTSTADKLQRKAIFIIPGSGGGGGAPGFNVNGGDGGRGGGALLIECAGALNFTGTINTSGSNGQDGANAGARSGGGGGGGGSAGMCVILYNTLTANTGTITSAGGNGGEGGDEAGFATNATGGGGGGGAGSPGFAGGSGGNTEAGGGNGGGAGAGGGGGGGGSSNGSAANGGGPGGTGGASMGGVVAKNMWFA